MLTWQQSCCKCSARTCGCSLSFPSSPCCRRREVPRHLLARVGGLHRVAVARGGRCCCRMHCAVLLPPIAVLRCAVLCSAAAVCRCCLPCVSACGPAGMARQSRLTVACAMLWRGCQLATSRGGLLLTTASRQWNQLPPALYNSPYISASRSVLLLASRTTGSRRRGRSASRSRATPAPWAATPACCTGALLLLQCWLAGGGLSGGWVCSVAVSAPALAVPRLR